MGERTRREGQRERRGGSIGIKIILCRNLTERDKRGEEESNKLLLQGSDGAATVRAAADPGLASGSQKCSGVA